MWKWCWVLGVAKVPVPVCCCRFNNIFIPKVTHISCAIADIGIIRIGCLTWLGVSLPYLPLHQKIHLLYVI